MLLYASSVMLIAFLLFRGPTAVRLFLRSATASGTVVGIVKAQHYATTVSFLDKGTVYRDTFPPHGLSIGDSTVVYYAPGNPRRASLERPSEALEESVLFSVAAGVMTIAVLVVAQLKQRRALTPN
jgi:hypothetical protein